MKDLDKAERGLAPAEPDWRGLFDASPFATLVFTPDLVLLHCNAAHTRNSGIPSERLAGQLMFEVFPKNPDAAGPDTEEAIRSSVARVLETGAPDEPPIQKHDLPREDGSFEPRYWRMIHSPLVSDGRIVAVRQDSWDVTGSVLETERQAALRRVAGIVAGVAFWELDPETDRIVRTPEFDVLFGFPARDPAGAERRFATYVARFHEDDRPMIEAAIADMMAEGVGAVRQFEYRIVRPEGAVRHAVVRAEVVDGPDGRPVLTGITLDLTELHAKEDRLSALVEEKEALLGEVNHRVKNSLQLVSAILSLEARRAGEADAGRLRSAAARVQSVAAVHAALYHGSDVRLVETGAHLRQFCDHLAESLGAQTRGIALVVDAEEIRLPAVQAIPLSLIVNELVANAFKHAFPEEPPEGAAVTVSLGRGTEDTYVLTVADNGRGTGTGAAVADSSTRDSAMGPQSGKEGGLGAQLVATLTRQIEGHVVQERKSGWSTRITFGSLPQ